VALPGASREPVASTLFHVDGLIKRYGSSGDAAVDAVTFDVSRGEIFGLIGPDGAGKTSIVQILAGVLSADGGTAMVSGIDVLRDPERVKALIGYMPQGLGLNLYDSLTVDENIGFFRDLRQVPAAQFHENRERLLQMTRLAAFVDRPAGTLSGGMRQKLALICTLLHLPDILLLDEPTTGVDSISRRDFWTIIHDLVTRRGATVLLTTAYMDEAERCHRVALMHRGRFIAQGPPEDLVAAVPGTLVSIGGVATERVLMVATRWPETESVAAFGRETHVLLRDGGATVEDRLATAGLESAEVRRIPAGLEDVFVHSLRLQAPGGKGVGGIDAGRVIERAPVAVDGGAVRTDALTRRFGEFVAVDRVTLSIETGEIFGLLGPNGAGKTTLIKMLCGLDPPSDGEARVAGLALLDRRAREALRSRIGYMSQRFSLYRDLTVTGNLELYAGLYGLSARTTRQRIAALLDALGLAAEAGRLTEALPLGLRQRVALAGALLHEPQVLFLDEPTSGVDPLARRHFWAIIHQMAHRAGITVLVSTHYMDEAEHCGRLGLMHRGRLIAAAPPAELKRQAMARSGPMVVVQTADFAAAFARLARRFPGAALYGRRIRWRSQRPDEDAATARALLGEAGLAAELTRQDLSIEDAFVDFIEHAGVVDA
jgi:ABC-2 type transport system ATP-binding protein